MTDHVEIWGPGGRRVHTLEDGRLTVGRGAGNDIVEEDDPELSRLHAVLEHMGPDWCVRDLASANGTFVNGERIFSERPLRSGDEVRVGRTRIVFRGGSAESLTVTQASEAPPVLTPRERDVLVNLCRPVLAADVFTEPATIRQIADNLYVSEAAVKQHLGRLYDKFGVHEGEERRRVRLANEAIRRGAVTLADLRRS